MSDLTPAAKKRHIQSGGQVRCPYCKADNELGDVLDPQPLSPVEDGDIEQQVQCTKCGKKWIDVFKLVDVREII